MTHRLVRKEPVHRCEVDIDVSEDAGGDELKMHVTEVHHCSDASIICFLSIFEPHCFKSKTQLLYHNDT